MEEILEEPIDSADLPYPLILPALAVPTVPLPQLPTVPAPLPDSYRTPRIPQYLQYCYSGPFLPSYHSITPIDFSVPPSLLLSVNTSIVSSVQQGYSIATHIILPIPASLLVDSLDNHLHFKYRVQPIILLVFQSNYSTVTTVTHILLPLLVSLSEQLSLLLRLLRDLCRRFLLLNDLRFNQFFLGNEFDETIGRYFYRYTTLLLNDFRLDLCFNRDVNQTDIDFERFLRQQFLRTKKSIFYSRAKTPIPLRFKLASMNKSKNNNVRYHAVRIFPLVSCVLLCHVKHGDPRSVQVSDEVNHKINQMWYLLRRAHERAVLELDRQQLLTANMAFFLFFFFSVVKSHIRWVLLSRAPNSLTGSIIINSFIYIIYIDLQRATVKSEELHDRNYCQVRETVNRR